MFLVEDLDHLKVSFSNYQKLRLIVNDCRDGLKIWTTPLTFGELTRSPCFWDSSDVLSTLH